MKLGIIIYSSDPETVWNAFRLGNFAGKAGDEVRVFLLGKGVECESIDTAKFKVSGEMKQFVDSGGKILACGTCLKIRHRSGSAICPLSSMQDLYGLIKTSDKVISF